MKNDGLCWIHIPTDLTDPTLSETGLQLVNALRALYDLPALQEGDTNPYYLQISRIGIAKGASIETGGYIAACGPVLVLVVNDAQGKSVDRIPLSLADDILSVGGDIEGLPLWIRLTNLNAVCPLGDGVETWATWGTVGQSHVPVQYGAYWYRSNAVGASGALLNYSELTPVRQSLVTLSEYRTIQQEFSTLP